MAQEIPTNETPYEREERLYHEYDHILEALYTDPENPELLFQEGDIYNQLGLYDKAIEVIEKSIKIVPTIKKYLQLALAYREVKKYNKSIEAYDKALEIEPNNPEIHNFKGFVCQMKGDLIAAMAEYQIAISIDENYTDALLNLGFVLDEIGNHEYAIQNYDKIISINPRDCCAYLNKGMSLMSSGRYKNAIHEFEKSIQIRSDDSCSHYNKGYAHYICEEWDDALNEFEIAVTLDEKYAEAYYYRGLIFDNRDNKKEALQQYSKAIRNGFVNPIVFQKRGDIYRLRHIYPKAISDYKRIVDTESSPTELIYHLAECYYHNKQYLDALFILKKIKPTKEPSSMNLNVDLMMADAYFTRNEYYYAFGIYNQLLYEIYNYLAGVSLDEDKYEFKEYGDVDKLRKMLTKRINISLDKLPEIYSEEWLFNSPERPYKDSDSVNPYVMFPRESLNNVLHKNNYTLDLENVNKISNSALFELNQNLKNYLTRVISDAVQELKRESELNDEEPRSNKIKLTLDAVNRAFDRWEMNNQKTNKNT